MPYELRGTNEEREAKRVETRLNFDWLGNSWLPIDILRAEEANISPAFNIEARLTVLHHMRDITKTAKASHMRLSYLWSSGGPLREAYEEESSLTSEEFWRIARQNLSESEARANSSSLSPASDNGTNDTVANKPAHWKRRTIKFRSSKNMPKQAQSVEAPKPTANPIDSDPTTISPGYLIQTETSSQLKERLDTLTSQIDIVKSHKEYLDARIATLKRAVENLDAFRGGVGVTFDTYQARFSTLFSHGTAVGTNGATELGGCLDVNETSDLAGFFQNDCAQFKRKLEAHREVFKCNIDEAYRNLAEVMKESEKLNVYNNLLKDVCQLKENMERHPGAWKM
ncbi:unnamed protein product [Clonostachys byssicola]|uniref:Uncharacterized protein n=1 Tax=Clonostachys byssicola TaxID=160290 RepID=A0A9N9UZ92_9HYPO|nr:unnamed protein product [Clonostachys byssicola]